MALCLGMERTISLARRPVAGLRNGTVPTGAPPIIVVVHSYSAQGGAVPPVQWEPEVPPVASICPPDSHQPLTALMCESSLAAS